MKRGNYLEMIPEKDGDITWQEDEEGLVVLQVRHKGLINKAAQKLFSKPPVTNIHLDPYGSWIWKEIDGKKTVMELADSLKQQFGEETEPLYPRIALHFQRMEQCRLARLDHRSLIKISVPPFSQLEKNREQRPSFFCKGVFNMRRYFVKLFSVNDAKRL